MPRRTREEPSQLDPDRHFRTDVLQQDLKQRTIRGGLATVAGHLGKVLLTLGSTMALARLLEPHDFGLVAMVMAIIGFSNMFRDFGLSAATVQRENLRHDQVSTLFWINLGISLLIVLAIAALAPAIAWFYSQPLLTGVTLALATASLFDGLSIQHNALLRRQMRFGAVAAIEISATAVSAAVAVSLAWLGASYWSLVALQLVMLGTRTTLLWIVSGWWPGRTAPLLEVRSMLEFGGHLTGSRMANYVTRNLDKILIGRFWSAPQLAFYHKADNGIVLPFQQASWTLSRVAVPTLSRLQNDPSRYRNYFRMAVLLVTAAAVPAVVFAVVDAEAAVRLVLGAQWLDTVPILRILAPVSIAEMVSMMTRWVFVSLGETRRLLRWRLVESFFKILGVALAVQWGPMGVATSMAVVSTALMFPGMLYCFRRSPLGIGDVLATAWRPVLAAAVGGLSVSGLRVTGLNGGDPLASLAIDVPVFAVVYIAVWAILPQGRATLKKLLQLARGLFP